MGGLTTTDYIEAAAAVALLYWAMKKGSGLEKYAALGLAAYLAYGVYQDYGGTTAA